MTLYKTFTDSRGKLDRVVIRELLLTLYIDFDYGGSIKLRNFYGDIEDVPKELSKHDFT